MAGSRTTWCKKSYDECIREAKMSDNRTWLSDIASVSPNSTGSFGRRPMTSRDDLTHGRPILTDKLPLLPLRGEGGGVARPNTEGA
jgi:hypothetical protein